MTNEGEELVNGRPRRKPDVSYRGRLIGWSEEGVYEFAQSAKHPEMKRELLHKTKHVTVSKTAGEKEQSGAADALYVTVGVPVVDWFKVYAKWDEFRANGKSDSSHDMYSACLNFRLHKNLNFQLEYRHHNNKLLPKPQYNELWFMSYIRF
jgi:hypothetical protein